MAKDDISLSFKVLFEAQEFKKAYEESFAKMQRSAQVASKKGQGSIGNFVDKMIDKFGENSRAINNATLAMRKYQKQLDEAPATLKELQQAYDKNIDKVEEWTEKLKAAREEDKEAIKEAIAGHAKAAKGFEARKAALEDFAKTGKDKIKDLSEKIEDMTIEFSGEALLKAAGEAGAEMVEPFSALLSKDLPGAVKSASKLFGKGIKSSFGAGGGLLEKAGGFLKGKGQARQDAGKGGAMASSMKGMGAATSGLGSFIKALGTLGPLIGVLGGAIAGMVKMFIDADSQVKEFNRDMLASAGTSQWFSKSVQKAGDGVQDMEDTLKGFRDAASGVKDNLDWGISAATHKEVLANLQAEGVQLTTLNKSYGQLNGMSAAYSKDQGAITQAAVAYSRQMGVSLQEVTSFQAEMMTEMGTSLGDTVTAFRQMSAGAEEAGIASNKFFAMIRGVSADLSLYNTRLEDAVKLLGKLGKVMSPRNAQKFMQTAMNAYKGMSFQDKVKSSLLAGKENTAKIVSEDIDSKNASIAKAIADAGGGTVDEIKAALEKGPAGKDAVKDFIKKADPTKQGTLKEAVSSLNSEKRMAKGGLVGNARALSKVSVVGAAEHKFLEASHFKGDEGSLQGMAGDALAGLDDETKQLYQNMADQISEQRDELVKQGKMTAKEAKEASWTKIYDTMDQGQKDAADGKNAQEEANKRMGSNIQSMTEKMDQLMNWFMNTFYNLMLNIWDTIADLGVGNKDARKAQIAAMKGKNQELMSATGGETTGIGAVKAIGNTSLAKKFMSSLQVDMAGQSRSEATMHTGAAEYYDRTGNTAEAEKSRQAALDANQRADTLQKQQDAAKAMVDSKLAGAGTMQSTYVSKAQSQVGGDAALKLLAAFGKQAAAGGAADFDAAGAEAGLTSDQIGNIRGSAYSDMAGSGGAAGMTEMLLGFQKILPTEEQQTKAVSEGLQSAAPDLGKLATEGTKKGSIFTHDETVANAIRGTSDVAPEGMEEQTTQQEATVGTLSSIEKVLKETGIKLNKSWMENQMAKMIEGATLDALRVGLLEFYMYKDLSTADVGAALGRGVDPKKLGADLLGQAQKDGKTDIARVGQNAAGGEVVGISNGLAQVRAAAGEGLASIGKGERIIPAGGGGQAVRIELAMRGDLKNLIEAVAQDVYVKQQAASKNR